MIDAPQLPVPPGWIAGPLARPIDSLNWLVRLVDRRGVPSGKAHKAVVETTGWWTQCQRTLRRPRTVVLPIDAAAEVGGLLAWAIEKVGNDVELCHVCWWVP